MCHLLGGSVTMINRTMQIFVLDQDVKNRIQERLIVALEGLGYEDEELDEYVENGMDGRLCDLEDVIDIDEFLQ